MIALISRSRSVRHSQSLKKKASEEEETGEIRVEMAEATAVGTEVTETTLTEEATEATEDTEVAAIATEEEATVASTEAITETITTAIADHQADGAVTEVAKYGPIETTTTKKTTTIVADRAGAEMMEATKRETMEEPVAERHTMAVTKEVASEREQT